ncbi:hypothetical protein [Nocardia niwae]|uniref:hypothetical protein n=1 Tax=Nocardia niwae TaxID=626084 RepID=UPI0033FBDD78
MRRGGSELPGLERRFDETIEELKQLGHAPGAEHIEQLRARLEELVAEVRRTVPADDERRFDLILRGRQARGLLVDATERVRRNRGNPGIGGLGARK